MIQYQATMSLFNAKCDSQFVALNRDNFPKDSGNTGRLHNCKPCLSPVKSAENGTGTTKNVFKYFANSSKFNARCESPMATFQAENATQPHSLNCQPCLKPVP